MLNKGEASNDTTSQFLVSSYSVISNYFTREQGNALLPEP